MPNADRRTLHVLVSTTRAALFEALRERVGPDVRVDREDDVRHVEERLQRGTYDALLIDHRAGAEAIARLARRGSMPVIVAGDTAHEVAHDAASGPAAEYISLDTSDTRSILRILRRVVERARLADELRLPQEVLEIVAERVPTLVTVVDATGHVQWINREHERTLGWTIGELRGSHFLELCGSDAADREQASRLLSQGDGGWATFRLRRRDGRAVETSWLGFRLADGTLVAMGRDITEPLALRRRLARAEKLEALGRLAGGIAHDFNNLLTIIAGNTQLLLEHRQPEAETRAALEEIARAADSAGAVVKQLLTFTRREPQPPRPIDLNAAIEDMRDMMARLIGSEVQLEFDLAADPSTVRLDVGQVEQMVINLLLNARDAMPRGGRVRLRTALAEAAPAAGARRHRVRPGKYVTLEVQDTGAGMDEETRQRVFEPFFTTKGESGGTGLGLASVHAIVTQAGGGIDVTSARGAGSTFTVYLPAAEAAADASAAEGAAAATGRSATVLVVEDHEVIRRLCRRVLEGEGHRVQEASSVVHALRLAGEMDELDLLLADVRLGGENSLELVRVLREERPGVRVLLMSGYASPEGGDAAFLEKPFTPAALVSAVRQVLWDS